MDVAEKTLQLKQDIDEVYEAGKHKEWSDFWDVYQNYGKRTSYYYSFYADNAMGAYGWTDLNFKPKYDIKPTDLNRGFRYAGISDLKKPFEDKGLVFDTSKCTVFDLAFGDMKNLEIVGIIDMSSATSAANTFNNVGSLRTIEEIIPHENLDMSNTFNGCRALNNLRFGGVAGKNTNLSVAPLTVESIISIITHLKDYSGDITNAGKYTLTLKDTCKTLMAEQGGIDDFGGKTYDQYLADIGWNLA